MSNRAENLPFSKGYRDNAGLGNHYSDKGGHKERAVANKALVMIQRQNPSLSKGDIAHIRRRSMRRVRNSGKR